MRWSSAYKFSAWEHISSPGTIPIPSTRKTEKQTLWLWKIFFLSICLAPNWKTTGHWTSNLSIILEFKNITWQKRWELTGFHNWKASDLISRTLGRHWACFSSKEKLKRNDVTCLGKEFWGLITRVEILASTQAILHHVYAILWALYTF